MALISPESLERVKQAADIVEVVSAHTDLRRQGARWVGLCPFHEERTPSFSVDAAGEALPLLRLRGRRRRDQVRRGEGRAGLRRGGGAARRPLRGRARARAGGPAGGGQAPAATPARAAAGPRRAFYANYLWESKEAAKAREYLAGRGLGEEVLRGFGVGYAPSAWDKILVARPAGRVSASRSCAASASCSAGARAASTTASARGSCSRSATAAAAPSASAAGRCAPTRAPSTSTPPRPTSSTRASCSMASTWRRRRSRKPARAVVVEGYTDVLALHQAGDRGGGRR